MKPRNDQRTVTTVEFTSLPTRRKRGRPPKASLSPVAEAIRPPEHDIRAKLSSRPSNSTAHHGAVDLWGDDVVFNRLLDDAMTSIEMGLSIPDQVLGRYAPLASLLRSVSFHEGRLLERALAVVAALHPDLEVLGKPLKLPLVQAAMQAISTNTWDVLEGVCFDADASTEGTYRPDLVILNRKTRKALIIDLKRSLAAYGASTRLADLKTRMMAAGLVLPDFLYKRHKRLSIGHVDIAVIDGASRSSDHGKGIWKLSELDELLDLPGAAAAMERLRSTFGDRVRALIEQQAVGALGLRKQPSIRSTPEPILVDQHDGPRVGDGKRADNIHGARGEGSPAAGDACSSDAAPVARILIGFARSTSGSG